MRKILAAALMATALSGAAYAADLPSRTAPVFAPPPPPVFTWTGGYLGVNAGYAFDYLGRFETFNGQGGVGAQGVPLQRAARAGVGSEGFTAGGQVGYNYQFGAGNGIVVGMEADAAYTDLGNTRNFSVGNSASSIHSQMDYLGTVRGRLGYAFDRVFVYGTGGFAYGDVSARTGFYNNTNTLLYSGNKSGMQYGYTYGGGVEYAIPTDSYLSALNFFHSSAVTIKAEFLHYDLGNERYAVVAVGPGAANAYSQRTKTDGDLARIGINYKF